MRKWLKEDIDFNKFFDDVIGVSFIESAEIGENKTEILGESVSIRRDEAAPQIAESD